MESWDSRAMVAFRRLLALFFLAMVWLLRALVWHLRVVLMRISPRARIVLLIIGFVLLSAWTSRAIPSVSEVAYGFAVLLMAFLGLWWIATAPF